MDLYALVNYLETYYRAAAFRDVAPNGLQVEGCACLERVACSVTASLASLEQAVAWGAQALIVHHGLFWEKSTPRIVGAMKQRLELLLDNHISLLAYHLPMDAHRESGNNWHAARCLGWGELQPYGDFLGQLIGVRGSVEGLTPDQLVQQVAAYYQVKPRIAGPMERPIRSVALISGGAHRSFGQAIEDGVDAFITGSADEPNWHESRESQRLFISVGHSASERIGPRALAEHLKILGLDSCFIEDDNPF